MLEKCALGSSSVCSEKQFCSEITFQMDEGDPHQITDTRGILTLCRPDLCEEKAKTGGDAANNHRWSRKWRLAFVYRVFFFFGLLFKLHCFSLRKITGFGHWYSSEKEAAGTVTFEIRLYWVNITLDIIKVIKDYLFTVFSSPLN